MRISEKKRKREKLVEVWKLWDNGNAVGDKAVLTEQGHACSLGMK
jgi:hypothetical protein